MLLKVILLLLPVLTYGDIRLHLRASTQEESNVEAQGSIVNVVKDEDISAFGLDYNSLKQAIKAYSGAEPLNLYFRAPTEVDGQDPQNFFEEYHLNEVTRKITPMDYKVVDYITETVDLGTNYSNEFDSDKIYFGTTDLIWGTHGYWLNDAQLVVDNKNELIYYSIEKGINNLSPNVISSFYVPYGRNVSDEMYIHMRKEFVPNKGHDGDYGLRVTKTTVEFKIDYSVSLGGQIACYYPEDYKGKKVWGYYIDDIFNALGKPNKLETSEILQVVFYSNAEIYPL